MMVPVGVIQMPKLGLTMTEGLIASWMVAPGDVVRVGDPLFVVETEKVANEIAAEVAGRIDAILVQEGETVAVGATLATLAQSAAPTAPALNAQERRKRGPALSLASRGGARRPSTPLARKIAAENDISLRDIAGSGPNGRIKAQDVLAAISAASRERFAGEGVAGRQPQISLREPDGNAPAVGRIRQMTSFERVAAQRLAASKRDTPHFYVFAEADVSSLLTFRERMNRDPSALKLTLTHFLVAAVARALEDSPDCNAVWRDGEIVLLDDVGVGVAVDTPRGLVAPVLRSLARLGVGALASGADDLIARARDGRLGANDFEPAALSVSNVGMFGVSRLAPIINPGQSAILGVGGAKPVFRPDERGAPRLAQELALVLSADHRVWDGARAARFLDAIVKRLEDPLLFVR